MAGKRATVKTLREAVSDQNVEKVKEILETDQTELNKVLYMASQEAYPLTLAIQNIILHHKVNSRESLDICLILLSHPDINVNAETHDQQTFITMILEYFRGLKNFDDTENPLAREKAKEEALLEVFDKIKSREDVDVTRSFHITLKRQKFRSIDRYLLHEPQDAHPRETNDQCRKLLLDLTKHKSFDVNYAQELDRFKIKYTGIQHPVKCTAAGLVVLEIHSMQSVQGQILQELCRKGADLNDNVQKENPVHLLMLFLTFC